MPRLALLLATVAAIGIAAGCAGDDDDAPTSPAEATEAPAVTVPEEIDLEAFAIGETYSVGLAEMARSGASGNVLITGVGEGDVSILVEMEGVSDGRVSLRGGISVCPADSIPSIADRILTLSPLADGASETSPVGVSTEAFEGQNIFVFSGPWAIIVDSDSGDPVACGIIPQAK